MSETVGKFVHEKRTRRLIEELTNRHRDSKTDGDTRLEADYSDLQLSVDRQVALCPYNLVS